MGLQGVIKCKWLKLTKVMKSDLQILNFREKIEKLWKNSALLYYKSTTNLFLNKVIKRNLE